jgi:hypothetical protein
LGWEVLVYDHTKIVRMLERGGQVGKLEALVREVDIVGSPIDVPVLRLEKPHPASPSAPSRQATSS